MRDQHWIILGGSLLELLSSDSETLRDRFLLSKSLTQDRQISLYVFLRNHLPAWFVNFWPFYMKLLISRKLELEIWALFKLSIACNLFILCDKYQHQLTAIYLQPIFFVIQISFVFIKLLELTRGGAKLDLCKLPIYYLFTLILNSGWSWDSDSF